VYRNVVGPETSPGAVAGQSGRRTDNYRRRATCRDASGAVQFNVPGGIDFRVTGINDAGQVAGIPENRRGLLRDTSGAITTFSGTPGMLATVPPLEQPWDRSRKRGRVPASSAARTACSRPSAERTASGRAINDEGQIAGFTSGFQSWGVLVPAAKSGSGDLLQTPPRFAH